MPNQMKINKDLIISDTNYTLGDIPFKDIYSTGETLTNKVFLNKPVYRRVFELNLNGNAQSYIDLSSIKYEYAWVNFGMTFNYYNNESLSSASINWYAGATDFGLCWIQSARRLQVKNASSASRHYFITLEYIKV